MGNNAKGRVITMALLAAMFSSCIGGALVSSPDSQAAKKAKLKTKKVTLQVGKKKTIKITGKKKKAVYTFKASNKKVKVTKKGVIQAVSAGTAKITVKERYQKKTKKLGTVKVTVKKRQEPTPSQAPVPSTPGIPQVTSPSVSGNPQVTPPSASGNPQVTSPATSADPQITPPATESGEPSESQKPSESGSPSGDFTPVEYKNAEFETGTDGFTARIGSEKVSVADDGYSGKCLFVTGRKNTYDGAKIDVIDTIVPEATYSVTAYLKHMAAEDIEIKCSAQTGNTYPAIAVVEAAKPGEWTKLEGTIKIPESFSDFSIYFELPGSPTADFYVDSVVITQLTAGKKPVKVNESILETYKDIFPYMGTCANYYGYGNKANQLISGDKIAFIKKHFNSITLENEMKPDAVLNSIITKEEAQASPYNYVIPENYTEENVPSLNFNTIDNTLEFCKDNGIKMRAHTLMWHQQTPSWFFAKNYESSGKATDAAIMDARLEFYVRNVMKHVIDKEIELTGKAGSLVYAWDVTNEYLHRSNDPTNLSWVNVYGDLKLKPTYVKKAFELAYEVLESYGIEDKVTLFYNDYDTYFESNDLVTLVTYINANETNKEGQAVKICGGIGMQSHVDADRPTLKQYGDALDKFLATGLEVQITELDATINFGELSNGGWGYLDKGQDNEYQAAFIKEFMELVITKQKTLDKTVNPKGITGVTIWGLYDACSWRSECSPLLFAGSIKSPKPSFYAFIEAAKIWEQ